MRVPHPRPRFCVRYILRAALAALLAAMPPLAATAAAQRPEDAPPAGPRFARPTLRALGGVAAGTAFADDENGTTVRPALAPLLGVEAASRVGERTALTLTLRAARPQASIEFDGAGTEVDAGAVTALDLTVGVERTVHPAVAVRGGVGLLYLKGPAAVAPFRFNNAASARPMLDFGAALRAPTRLPLHLSLGWQGFRYGAASVADPIDEAGLVQRVVLGVRYGR